MYKRETVIKHRERISKAVEELFNLAINNQETEDDIVCFLCNGQINYGLPMFGPGERGITDIYQSEFLVDYMNSSEETELYKKLDNDEDKKRIQRYSVNVELMLYSHIWETYMSLGNLKHLANFVDGLKYDWRLSIPRQSKWKFITNTIRSVFEKYNLEIAELLKETYNSQLRNAFAHGQYGLFENTVIRLFNYNDEKYEIPSITFEDWEERFIKTVDIFLAISNQKHALLQKYSIEKPVLRVWTPFKNSTKLHRTEIYWEKYSGYYSFNANVMKTT